MQIGLTSMMGKPPISSQQISSIDPHILQQQSSEQNPG